MQVALLTRHDDDGVQQHTHHTKHTEHAMLDLQEPMLDVCGGSHL